MIIPQVADAYLHRWKDIMESDLPLREINWIIPGSMESESLVAWHMLHMAKTLEAHVPVSSRLYTNCVDVAGWDWAYVVPTERHPTKASHQFMKATWITSAMYHSEHLVADMYITNGLTAAFALLAHDMVNWNQPTPPIVAFCPKAPTGAGISYETPHAARIMLKALTEIETFWIMVHDNQSEVALMRKALTDAGASRFDRLRKVNSFDYDPATFVDDHDPSVVWSGRLSMTKNPRLGVEVYALLPPYIEKHVFLPVAVGTSSTEVAVFEKLPGTELHVSVPSEEYRAVAGRARVNLVTSTDEGYPIGYLELWGQGVLPVIYDQPWTYDLLPENWPLRFKKAGEGAEMVIEAMENPDKYLGALRDYLAERFDTGPLFAGHIADVWEDYRTKMGDSIRLLQVRGAWRSL